MKICKPILTLLAVSPLLLASPAKAAGHPEANDPTVELARKLVLKERPPLTAAELAKLSPEKQAALKEEIERLSAETEENQRACRLLSDRLEGLRAADGESGETRERLACELLLRVQAALQGTEQALSEQEQTLAEARGQAEALEARFAACETERQRLSDWLEAEETPLQAMMRALEHPEAEQLRQTLDIGSVERVRALLEEARARLQELDEVLRRCAAAARLDRDALNRRARR